MFQNISVIRLVADLLPVFLKVDIEYIRTCIEFDEREEDSVDVTDELLTQFLQARCTFDVIVLV